MSRVLIAIRRVCLALLLTLLVGGAPVRAQESLAVSASLASEPLTALAPGFDRWLQDQLVEAGVHVVPLGEAKTLEQALRAAAERGVSRVLVPRLSSLDGDAEVELLLYAPDSGALLTGARAGAPTAELGNAAVTALQRVLEQSGGEALEITPPLLEDLVYTSQAIRRRRAGDLAGGFRAVQGKLSPTAMRLREEIVEEAQRSTTPRAERARVLAAVGDTSTAWSLVGRDAREELSKPDPDLALLVSAGEVMLSNDGPDEARRYFDRVLEIEPDHVEANIGLARVLELAGDRAAARATITRIAPLEPSAPRLEEQLAHLEDDPANAAAHWIEAGRRFADQLDVERAEEAFGKAIGADRSASGSANAAIGALEDRLGRPAKARIAYRRAVDGGARNPVVLTALGRAEFRTGDASGAEATLRSALSIDPEHPGALRELGTVYAGTGREAEAVPMLRTVHSLDPSDARTRLTLARALRATGDSDEAMALLNGEAVHGDSDALAEMAAIQEERGDFDAARDSLSRAVELEPGNAQLKRRLAQVLEQVGDAIAAAAARQAAESLDPNDPGEKHPERVVANLLSFDDLVMSFASQLASSDSRTVVSLGVREPGDWETRLRALVRPHAPDLEAIDQGLQAAVSARFAPARIGAEAYDALTTHIDRLYDFENDLSLSAETIATVNEVLGVDGVFAVRLIVQGEELTATCGADAFAVEMRLLMGRNADDAAILSNLDCLDGAFDVYGKPNVAAIILFTALGLLIVWPVVRGWGQIVVRIHLPERTKGFFSIHITKRPDAVKRQLVDETTGREKSKGRKLDFLMRYRRYMAGPETLFRLIPARKSPYTVTISGPLMDARGEEVIGHFLEEQRVTVRRRRASTLEFDLRPKEVAVEVMVKEDGQPASAARVAVQGDPTSLRYARDGVAFLYLERGTYVILVGSHDAAARFELNITSLESAIPLQVEMKRSEGLVFQDCPDAVEPYLQSDLDGAAQALERAGNTRAAHLLRAELFHQKGQGAQAARELEAAGELGGAALELAGGSDFEGSAALYEEAGELDRAAAAFRDAGSFQKAAECFEKIYDYGNALDCWREVGDSEREMLMLEKLGEFMEAAQIARELGDPARVIQYLQHIEQRHSEYGDACRMIAELASEDGDHDLAVVKFEEALSATGIENASIETLESYASVLERAGKLHEALSAYEAIRRQDVARSDVATRIQELKRELSASEGKTQPVAGVSVPAESRYELIEEIGRGGMGVVYKARDTRLGRVVALKRLPENLRDHPAAVELFEREARAAAALNHVNIVTIFDAGEENGTYFITMELLEGRPLNAILDATGRVSVQDTMRLGIQICSGLHYAHERRIVHRDIKTANLFFTKEQVVKIMDFGIAKSMEEVRRSTTVVGGTPYYMAPEQAAGESVDHRADLYALGVTLFLLCTGSLPFEDGDVAYQHRHEAPPDPRELNLNVPAELAREILGLMEKDPGARPANAAVVGARLGELLGRSG